MYLKLLVILSFLSLSVNSPAEDDGLEPVRQTLKDIMPDLQIDEISESSIPGLYTVLIGAEIFYVSADGQYLLRGDLIDIKNRSNLSEAKRTTARRELIQKVKRDQLISFTPENPQHNIYVFTDITCGFCQKFQGDIREINNRGIAVNYLAFPRDGADSVTAKRMQSVWCAKDRQTAFMDAMIGLNVEATACDNPVTEHFGLGQAMGVNGTPAIFTENGTYLRGYMPPDDLLKALVQD